MDLNSVMEFDHVIRVHEDGTITDESGMWGPETVEGEAADSCEVLGMFHDGGTTRDRWVLLNGYSGQDRYAGPVMHNSEFIGGGLETDIRETPGVYVALLVSWAPEDEDNEDEDTVEGWVVARFAGRVPWIPGVGQMIGNPLQ